MLSHRAPRLLLAGLAAVLATMSVAILPAPEAGAAPVQVSNCNDSGPGSLRMAVSFASPGDTIIFTAAVTACSPIVLTGGPITIAKDLTIMGPGASDVAVSGDENSQVFVVNAGVTVSISGLTVEDGVSNAYCGGPCGTSGGGIETSGTLTLTSVVVMDNATNLGCTTMCGANGGGVENDAGGTLSIVDSTLTENDAGGLFSGCTDSCGVSGGAIENLGTLTVTDSTLSDNFAEDGCGYTCGAFGGAIDNEGTATIDDSTVSGNQADNSCTDMCGPNGGGIQNDAGAHLTIHNSTVADNSANTGCTTECGAAGGGLYNIGTFTSTNSTFSGNDVTGGCSGTCGNSGGGIYNDGTGNVGATIVANSVGGDCDPVIAFTDLGYNLDDDGTCGFGLASDLSDTPSGLDPAGLQENGGPTETIALESGSQAIEHVAAALCPPTDQRGYPRTPPCDIGAYDTDHASLHGSEVHAVIQVETSPVYAGHVVDISSTQLQLACGGTIVFETLQRGSTTAPVTGTDFIAVVLDDDGNATLVVDGTNCAPGADLIEADLPKAPYLTATTNIVVDPPQTVIPTDQVSADPATEVETGDTTASGESDVYTVFTVNTDPVYAEQPVEISSPQLEARCQGGWLWEPGSGGDINQTSGSTVATGFIDDDGNATFVFKGADCAPGTSTVTADIVAGTQPTYTTTFTIDSPAVTLATHKLSAAPKASKTKHRRRHHRGPTATTPPTVPPAMTVTASPNALVETGATPEATLNVVKSDDASPEPGTSSPPTTGEIDCGAHGITYYITVTNSGPDDLDAVQVQDSFSGNADGDFDSDRYTATDAGGASGYTALAIGPGFNDIDDIVDLPSGSSITYTVTATIDNDDTSLTNTATLTPPSGVELTADSNLSATDNDDFYCGG